MGSWSFGPGQSAALGGAHQKTLHAAPGGSMWLFKPDSSGGARAAAEAAASQIYQRVGVPSVGVYEREQRRWLAHVTVVRFRERPRLRPPLPELGEVVPSDAAVYLSQLRPTGARYVVVESAALGG